jgi:hypothetical protein
MEEDSAAKVHLLLQAAASPNITNENGLTPLDYLLQKYRSHHASITLLEESLADSKKAWLLVKASRPVVSASSIAMSSCMRDPAARGDHVVRASDARKKKEGGKGTYQGWGLGFFGLVGREQRRKGKGELVA